jgi:tropomyosin
MSHIKSHNAISNSTAMRSNISTRLRQTDVKAGHYERKVQALEQSVVQWEQKYEEMEKKYRETQAELEKFAAELGQL